MPTVDWPKLLDSYGVPYVTDGPNVAAGNINVRCPMCGTDDPSEHMGINLKGKGWACWRNAEHRGKAPARLISMLIGCSIEQANSIIGNDVHVPENFMERINKLLRPNDDDELPLPELPSEFKSFAYQPTFQSAPFRNYLIKRGFQQKQIERFTQDYDIFFCRKGPYRSRVIFAVYHERQLVGWTGRTIANSVARYKTLSPDIDKAAAEGYVPAPKPITDYLLWFDDLMRSDAFAIYLCEGPFDALKVSELGRNSGRTATCLFTSSISEAQIDLLHRVLPRFERRYILLDDGMLPRSMWMQSRLSALKVSALRLPAGVDDPGDLQSLDQLVHCGFGFT